MSGKAKRPQIFIIFLFIILIYQNTLIRFTGLSQLSIADDALLILGCSIVAAKGASKLPKLLIKYFIFLAFLIVPATINSVEVDVTAVQMRSYFFYSLLLFIIWNSKIDADGCSRTFAMFSIAFFPAVIIGLLEFLLQRNLIFASAQDVGSSFYNEGHFRVISVVGNSIDFGNIAAVIFMLGFHNLYKSSGSTWNTIFLIALGIVLIGSGSRGPLIAMTIALLFTTPLKKNVIAIMIGGVAITVAGQTLLLRTSADLDISNLEVNYRFIWLLQFIEVLTDHPIFGVGPGKFGGWVSINYHTSHVYDQYNINTFGVSTIDMFWPHLVAEVGLVGIAIFFAIWVQVYRSFSRKSKHGATADLRSVKFSRMAKSTIIFVFIISFVNSGYEIQSVQFLLFAIVGVSAKALLSLRTEAPNILRQRTPGAA